MRNHKNVVFGNRNARCRFEGIELSVHLIGNIHVGYANPNGCDFPDSTEAKQTDELKTLLDKKLKVS